jgi:X-X-X-Leu-X-X-Gly heptad repeat protein
MKTLKKRKRNRSRFLVKPIVAILLLAFVVGMMPGFVQAEREAKLVTMPTSDKSKREVVFARLRATGDVDNVYVVNHFNPARMSSLTDYGDYEEVIQLTGSVPPVLSGTTVSIAEAEGPYYYQGNLRSRELPWFFEMTWRLDGETIYPERLSGVSGELELEMSVKRNDQVDADFFDHYALQISIPIDPERAQIVAASEGFIVSYAGTEQQMTYMALPGLETTVKAIFDVKDFAMGQITIAGVPLVLNIDMDALGEFDDMLTPLSELESGIAEFADGATKLRQGYKKLLDAYNKMRDGGGKLVSGGKELTSGANQLKAGVGDYTSGVDRYVRGVQQLSSGFQAFDKGVRAMYQGTQLLKGESAQLVNASSSILGGLNEIVDRLPPPESFDGVEIPEITPEMENELEKLKQGSEVIRIGLEALATDGGGISQLVFGLRQVKEQLNFLKTQASQFAIPMSPVVSRDANEWKTYMEALGFSYSDTGSPEVEQSFYAQLATMSKYASDYRAAVIMSTESLY